MPMTALLPRSAVQFIVLLLAASSGTVAQTIEIKLVNGRDGRPMANKCVNVGTGHLDHMLAIPTGNDGVARLRLTNDDSEINVDNHWKACGDWE